jgi:hypothetical protein
MSTSDTRSERLLTDDRGAIMVMGIFMCSCLVGALWYLAGIGDAILYRERLQEAADAVAFSDAALHARGMNLIVLLNLVMAVILSVRVALRVGKVVMTVAAAIFGTSPGTWAAVPPTAAAAVAINNVDNATKNPIDLALRGLNTAQEVIAKVTPALAHVGATSVGFQYGIVAMAAPLVDASVLDGLPVEKRRPDKLCGEAATVIPKVTAWLLGKVGLGAVGDIVAGTLGGMLESVTAASPKYFCDLESGGSSPNTDGNFDKAAQERCDNVDEGQEWPRFLEAEKRWLARCKSLAFTCTSRDAKDFPLRTGLQPGSIASKELADELDRLKLDRDLAAQSLLDFIAVFPTLSMNSSKCFDWAKEDLKKQRDERDKQTEQQKKPSSSSSSSSSGIMPMLVKDFTNGSDRGQIVAGVRGKHEGLRKASKIVRIGAFHDKRTRKLADTEAAQIPAWAQAELFYDCAGKWKDGACDDDDDAMWHFKWRARLRRFNQPSDQLLTLAALLGAPPPTNGHDRFAEKLASDAVAPLQPGVPLPNAGLRQNLAKLLRDRTTRTQGVH